ncbi:MAG TPA: hypothetical protein VGB37_11590, partial [Candidatus Lokiarchaeia archaeon]
MKKAIMSILIIICFFNSLHSDSFDKEILNKFYSKEGILTKVYDVYTSKNRCVYGEELIYCIMVSSDSSVSYDETKKIKEIINKAFELKHKRFQDSTNCVIPKLPYYPKSEAEFEGSILKQFTNIKKYFVVKQKLIINKSETTTKVKIDRAIYYQISDKGFIEDSVHVRDSFFEISGNLYFAPKHYIDIPKGHRNIAEIMDNLVEVFWTEHEIQKAYNDPYLGYDYIKQNRKIFQN